MTRHFSVAALIAAVLMHAALVIVLNGSGPADKPAVPLPLAVELLRPASPAPAPAPAPAPTPTPASKPAPKPAPARKAQTRPQPDKPTRREALPPPTPAPAQSVEPELSPAPTPAQAPSPAPAATPVYLSASYAARNRPPDYPALSRRYGEQGTVTIRVLVQADGSAGKVEIAKSSGYALLDEAARNAVRGWRFGPATRDGKPVADWYLTPVVFKLEH
jgi:periplasmic protein TonB